MSVSSGTVNLFTGVAIAIAAASAGAVVLKNPEMVNAALDRYAAEWRAAQPQTKLAHTETPQQTTPSYGEVVLRAGQKGQFLTEAEINGRPIDVLVDTGASIVALTYEDAERAGLYMRPSDFTHQASTANGIARIAPVTIDRIMIGDIEVRNVPGAVSERGALQTTLLGMSFIGRLSRFDMRDDTLILAE